MLAKIMLFYAILSFCVGPVLGYEITKTKNGISYGILVGCIVSIMLWYKIGINKIQVE